MNAIKNHGTKMLGVVGTLASVFATADPMAVAALLGERGPYIVTGALSILTILRGFSNTKQSKQ